MIIQHYQGALALAIVIIAILAIFLISYIYECRKVALKLAKTKEDKEALQCRLNATFERLKDKSSLNEDLFCQLQKRCDEYDALKQVLASKEDTIKALEDTVEKFHVASKKEEPKAIYYIQLKYNTADAKPWETLTKDLFYDRRNFRSLKEAVKELKRRMNEPYVMSARIVTANERVLKKGEWYV